MFFFPKTTAEESYKDAVEKLSLDEKEICRYEIKQLKEREINGKKVKEVQNNFCFKVQNGLLSGWKLTSLMGSIYNCSTNYYSNFWHLRNFGIIPTNYIVQGDDTHFKCRFLA